ncbi:hypothetical protein BGL34_03055 [Fructilactobacillus lindneri]|nr:hypothetical protein [Fructilactobacillus lindneri]ANZ57887.1 hypothetical protein AYR60_03475 [Fructilactobacillus lindneri]ANZ59156.1 hypothetical protein AYR59_03475 [Fructilactobacillus lindneri]POG98206.1 hypothetical protein BGL31_03805 [Fructilactobacillus lindneri]POH01677.1 hypothetical protein BGL32_03625 [Fructilactobacillus lindneri]POH03520.1 hypothetical protein BGL33_02510 [Fructilactobacillus lindneri]
MEDNIQLGNSAFDKMMFTLKTPVTKENHKDYKFMEYQMDEIADGIWAMPVYMTENDDFTLFFVVTKIKTGETVMAFSEGILGTKGDFNLSQPMNTGTGLNLLTKHDKERAENVLHFLNQIAKAGEGNWRIVEE